MRERPDSPGAFPVLATVGIVGDAALPSPPFPGLPMNSRPSPAARTLPLLAALALLAACGDSSGPTTLTVAALEGHWRATSLRYRDLADTTLSQEMVATGLQTIDLTFQGDLYARVDTFPTPRFALAIDSGTVVVAGAQVTLASDGGTTLTLGGRLVDGDLVLADTVPMRLLCPTGCTAPTEVRYRLRRAGG